MKVQGPSGVVVSIAAWMIDPVACAGMTLGAPHVDLAALIDLNQMLTDAERNRRSPDDSIVVQEERNEDDQNASPDTGAATTKPVVRVEPPDRLQLARPEQGKDMRMPVAASRPNSMAYVSGRIVPAGGNNAAAAVNC